MSEIVNAGDCVDKTLIAVKRIPVYKQAVDGAEVAGYVEAGQPAGVVYAWLNANPGLPRSTMWWSFYPVNGMWYYAPHDPNAFSLSALKQQGVITVTEKTRLEQEAAANANRTWYEKLINQYWWIPIVGIAVWKVPGIISASRGNNQ